MNRREFLTTSIATTSIATTGIAATELAGAAELPRSAEEEAAGGGQEKPREYYELRKYGLRRGGMTKRFDDYMRDAFIPTAKRLGLGPIGVFGVAVGPDSPSVYVLIPHKTADSALTLVGKMAADPDYQKAGAPFITASPSDPPYIRVESSLLMAFEGMPALEAPPGAAENKPRVFELRTYESHSKKASRKKIEMFNKGEIDIFRRVGIRPVFFGETLIGTHLPNLTYLVAFDDMAARDKNFGAFIADPEWKRLSTLPEYTEIELVTNITNVLLRPMPYSQI